MKIRILKIGTSFSILATTCLSVFSVQTVTPSWNANPEPDIQGYNLYYGDETWSYTNKVFVVGNQTTTTVGGLVEGRTYRFVVTASNTSGLESVPSNEVIYRINSVPVANSQSRKMLEDQGAKILLTGTDADGDALTYQIVSGPTHGRLQGTPPLVRYTPALNFTGTETFTFKVNDGKVDSAIATVTLRLLPVNDAPVADNLNLGTLPNQAVGIALSGHDVDGDLLTYQTISGPSHGQLTGTAPNLVYLPALNFSGSDGFSYKVNDGTLDSAVATVSITVSAVSVATVPSLKALTEQLDSIKISLSDGENQKRRPSSPMRIKIQATIGWTYDLQASQDLQTWSTIGSITARTEILELEDLEASLSTMRFYRIAGAIREANAY